MPVPGTDEELAMIRVESLKRFLVCHVERSETSLAMTLTRAKRSIQRFFASIRMTMPVEGLTLQRFN
jgi:hypothetical protein